MKTVRAAAVADALGVTERHARRLADQGHWPCEISAGKRLYPVAKLPREVRAALHAAELRSMEAALAERLSTEPEPVIHDMGPGVAKRRDVKLEIFRAYEDFRRASGYADATAWTVFAEFYKRACALILAGGLADGPEAIAALPRRVFEAHPKMSRATIRRICETVRKGRLADLGGRYRTGPRSALARAENGSVADFITALLARMPHLSASQVRTQIAERFAAGLALTDEHGEVLEIAEVPSLRTVQRVINGLKKDRGDLLLRLGDPDTWKSRRAYAFGRAEVGDGLNALWEIDASPADILLSDGRHSLYVVIDTWSRRIMALVTRTPRAQAVLALIRRAVTAWGVPQRIKTDNGQDFVAAAVQRALAALQIEWDPTAPYSPEQKPHVERAIGTVQRGCIAQLPGFAGHSVAQAQKIRARKAFAQRLGAGDEALFEVALTRDELQVAVDSWIENHYLQRPHEGLRKRTPAVVAAGWTQPIRRVENERALDLLLAPVAGGLRKVTKNGIRVEHATYHCSGLFPGDQVLVRFDPAGDMGRLWCFAPDGERFLGVAVCPELVGASREEAAARAKAEQKAMIRAQIDRLAPELKQVTPAAVAKRALAGGRQQQAEPIAFPRAAEPHTTAPLAAAAQAISSRAVTGRAVPAPLSPREAAEQAAALEELQQAPRRSPEELREAAEQERFARAIALQGRQAAGERLADEEAAFLARYVRTREYAGRKAAWDFEQEWERTMAARERAAG